MHFRLISSKLPFEQLNIFKKLKFILSMATAKQFEILSRRVITEGEGAAACRYQESQEDEEELNSDSFDID